MWSLVFFLSLLPSSSIAASTDGCFQAAADRWKVPEKVLQAIARYETGGFHNIPDIDEDHGHKHLKTYGVMGLRNDEVLGQSLLEASRASGHAVSEIIQNPCVNIDAAAALLADELGRNGQNLDEAIKKYWMKDQPKESLLEFKALLASDKPDLRLRLAPNFRAGWCWRFWTDCEPTPPAPPIPGEEEEYSPPSGNGGEYPGADFQASSNYKPGSIRQLYVVLHTTEGNFNGAVSWLSSPKSGVSAHYVIRKSDGYVKQLVRERDRAFHARCWNSMAIGIEMEGFSKDSSSLTSPLLRSAANLSRYLARKYGIAANETRIVGHDAGSRGKLGGTGLERCNDHGDPGVYFDWSLFWRLLGRG